jgi:signal transduction histidine kinase
MLQARIRSAIKRQVAFFMTLLLLVPSLVALCILFARALVSVKTENDRLSRTIAEHISRDLESISSECYAISEFLAADPELTNCYAEDYVLHPELKLINREALLKRFRSIKTVSSPVRIGAVWTRCGELFNFLEEPGEDGSEPNDRYLNIVRDNIAQMTELGVNDSRNRDFLKWYPLDGNLFVYARPRGVRQQKILLGSRRAYNRQTGEYAATYLFVLPENLLYEKYAPSLQNPRATVAILDVDDRLISASNLDELAGRFGTEWAVTPNSRTTVSTARAFSTGWQTILVEPAGLVSRETSTLIWYFAAAIAIDVLVVFTGYFIVSRHLTERENHSRELHLKVLQSQLNPHLMYNALETIVWKANQAGSRDIAKIATMLGKFLRFSITLSDTLKPLEQIIQHLLMYIDVEKLRYKDNLQFEILPFPEELLTYRMPPMLLQPCVENAIMHGKRPGPVPLTISLSIEQQENTLVFCIKDDGIGISCDRLEKIHKNQYFETRGSRIGLRNIQERLGIFFGKGYGLSIESKEGAGTVVTIKVPVIKPQP